MVKNLPAIAGDSRFHCWVGKIPWRRKWQPNPVVFLPGKSHGQRGAWQAAVHGIAKVRHDLMTKQQNNKNTMLAKLVQLKLCSEEIYSL